MKTSEACIAEIKELEGYRETAYQDPKGIWTVGYGWTQGVHAGTTMTESAADQALRARIGQIERAIAAAVEVPLTQGQFDALVDFEYNLGRGSFDHSELRKLLNKRQYRAAAEQFPRWCHAGDQTLPGLLKRRLVEEGWFLAA